jgi:hypothetical protein
MATIGSMKTTAAILVEAGRPLDFADILIPRLKSGQVLVRLASSGVCHKREMMLFAGVSSSSAIGTLVWVLGSRFGPIKAANGCLGVVALFVLPYQTYVRRRCRRERSQCPSNAIVNSAPTSSP